MDILGRIRHERIRFVQEYNKEPSAIYVGADEYVEMRLSADAMLIFGVSERNEVFGIPFFRVSAKTHLGFGA